MEVHERSTGRYRVRPGDDLVTISKRLFGDQRKALEIAQANKDVVTKLEPGTVLRVPGHTGTSVIVPDDDTQFPSLWRFIRKSPPTAAVVKEFERWNGGRIKVSEGEEVFFVDLRKKSYGY